MSEKMKNQMKKIFNKGKDESTQEAYQIIREMREDEFEKKGLLWKRGGGNKSKAWKLRYFLLSLKKGKKLYYYKQDGADWLSKTAKGFIDLTTVSQVKELQASDEKLHTFQLIGEDRNWILCSDSEGDKKGWMDILSKIINNTYNPEEKVVNSFTSTFLLDWGKFEIETEPISKGAQGQIFKGVWDGMVPVAVKMLIHGEDLDKIDRELFLKEIEILSKLIHPNIVRMYGFIWEGKKIGLVTEFVKAGDLSKYIYGNELNDPLKISLCISIACAMHYLHGQRLVHCDLKPQNILVENIRDATIKLCDFGLTILNDSATGKKNKNLDPIAGTPAYAAPELPTISPTEKVDVFSFAIIMWEIVTSKKAWEGDSTWDIDKKKASGKRPAISSHILTELIEHCWAQKPTDRPTFRHIYSALEEKKLEVLLTTVSMNNYSMGTNVSPEERISEVFGNSPSVDWDIFLSHACTTFNVRVGEFDHLRWLLGEEGTVLKSNWTHLIKWFHPLLLSDDYITGGKSNNGIRDTGGQLGFTISDVIDIAKHTWFFGFLDSTGARKVLLNKPPGTFLVRFSGEEGKFTLSAAHKKRVAHWRIVRENKGKGINVYTFNETNFNSIEAIIEAYKEKVLVSDDVNDGYINLTFPSNRNTDLKLLK